MNELHFSENLIRLRRDKKITQEELADFIGVTKASVSKWENRQSLPDILLLPALASFFCVTVDELLGYEPQLSREQIRRVYSELADDFSCGSFDRAMAKSADMVKKYYSCYPFLLQICILWLNHFQLADTEDKQREVLTNTAALCRRIIEGCDVLGICNDANMLEAMIKLQTGQAEKVIPLLEEIYDPLRLSGQGETVLIQAYQNVGNRKKAFSFTQISMYRHLLGLLGCGTQYLSVCCDDETRFDESIKRLDLLIEAYSLERLNPNSAAVFEYTAAAAYAQRQLYEQSIYRLQKYVAVILGMLEDETLELHGDEYFDCLEPWFLELELGTQPPRVKKLVAESARQSLMNPLFEPIKDRAAFKELYGRLCHDE